jgi:hypothetical protein
VLTGKLRDVRHATRFIQGNLVDAVQPRRHHCCGGAIHVCQADTEQGAGSLRHISGHAIAAEFDVVWFEIPTTHQSRGMSMGGDGVDVAGARINDEQLVASWPIGTAGKIPKTGGDGNGNRQRHFILLYSFFQDCCDRLPQWCNLILIPKRFHMLPAFRVKHSKRPRSSKGAAINPFNWLMAPPY